MHPSGCILHSMKVYKHRRIKSEFLNIGLPCGSEKQLNVSNVTVIQLTIKLKISNM